MIGSWTDGLWTGTAEFLTVRLIDSAGVWITDLKLDNPVLELNLAVTPELTLSQGNLTATVLSQILVDTIASFEGIDEAGAEGLIASIYGFQPGESLPDELPFSFSLELSMVP